MGIALLVARRDDNAANAKSHTVERRVAATEFGYWIALLALLPLIPGRNRGSRPGRIGGMLSLAAIPLLILPAYRAHEEG